MARQVMTGGAAWQGRIKQQTMQADANEKSALATHVLGDMVSGSINQNAVPPLRARSRGQLPQSLAGCRMDPSYRWSTQKTMACPS